MNSHGGLAEQLLACLPSSGEIGSFSASHEAETQPRDIGATQSWESQPGDESGGRRP